jgi:hypothetical protein
MRRTRLVDDRGMVSLTFLMSTGAMVLSMLGGIDMIRWAAVQARLQDAMDAAVLAGGRNLSNLSTSPTAAELAAWKADARGYLVANLPSDYMGSVVDPQTVDINVSYAVASGSTPASQTITMTAKGTLPLLSAGFLATKNLSVYASNQAIRVPKNNLELALVLDNTGSMGNGITGGSTKLAALKSAANTLITDLQAASASGSSVNIGIVPFTTTVRVRDAAGNVPNGWLSNQYPFGANWSGCMTEPRTANLLASPAVLQAPGNQPFEAYYDQTPSNLNKTGAPTYYNFNQNGCTATPTTFLTSTTTTLTNSINSMVASGSTIIASGVLWGWRMLAPSWRNTDSSKGWGSPTLPQDSSPYLTKAMIIITDGKNEPSPYDTFTSPGTNNLTPYTGHAGYFLSKTGTNFIGSYVKNYQPYGAFGTPSANSVTLSACNAAKAAGIKIWAIAFGNWSDVQGSFPMLQSCVNQQAYFAPSNADLKKDFQSIAGQLSQLRLTK